MTVFISVGEPSGDIHGANLIRDLKSHDSSMQFVGLGGIRMQAAGCVLIHELASLAVMGIVRAVKMVPFFLKLLKQVDQRLGQGDIEAVVLIDNPGFNWWVARKARKHGITVFYYGVPQMWGWAPWRIRKMRRLVDFALCKLPFEEPWYRNRGCDARYVGHPFFDELARQTIDRRFQRSLADSNRQLLLLPGSRTQELRSNLATLLRAADQVRQTHPETRVIVSCVRSAHADFARDISTQLGIDAEIFDGRTPELIESAHCTIACSGSVSLELMAKCKPTIIVYRVGPISWLMQSLLRRTKYITLVNLLAADSIERELWSTYNPDRAGAETVPFPEYLHVRDPSEAVARRVNRWLEDPTAYQQSIESLRQLNLKYAQTGASQRAASFIVSELRGDSTSRESAA